MQGLDLNIDFSQVQALTQYQNLPAGEYVVQVVDGAIKTFKSGENYYALAFQVLEGQYEGVVHFQNIRLWSQSPKSIEWAHRTLKSVAIAIGHKNPNGLRNTEELLGGKLIIRIKVTKNPDTGTEFSEANLFKPYHAPNTPQSGPVPISTRQQVSPQAPSQDAYDPMSTMVELPF